MEQLDPDQGDVADEVTKLKYHDGGPILVAGSRTLVHTLIEHDLIHEYRLMGFPVVLGSGKRLFPESPDKTTLELIDTKTFDTRRPGAHVPAVRTRIVGRVRTFAAPLSTAVLSRAAVSR